MNHRIIAGHLGADPEIRFTVPGQKVITFRLASRVRNEKTIWWRVTIWGSQFDKIISYFKKGSAIIVVGEINKPEIFTGRDGKPHISTSITASKFSPFGRPDPVKEGNSHFDMTDGNHTAAREFAYG